MREKQTLTATEKTILENLYRHRIIGAKHTNADNAIKSLPKSERGNAKKALKHLIREGYLTAKITSYGMEISLNPHKLQEIRDKLP